MHSISRILAIIFTPILGLLSFMGQVGPKQAMTNYAEWYKEYLGQPPSWINSHAVDVWGSLIAASLAIACLVWFFWPYIVAQRVKLEGANHGDESVLAPRRTAWKQEWHKLRFRRDAFWARVNKCYEHWNTRVPESLQEVIAGSQFPNDLPLDDSSAFSAWVRSFHIQVDDRSDTANDYASVLHQFACFIYEPNGSERKCLGFGGGNEFDRFDDTRRDLAKCWDKWGRQESLDRLITEQQMDETLRSSASELKLLTFLEIARASWRPTGSSGKSGLFSLAKRVNSRP